jgi:hypothetical protein
MSHIIAAAIATITFALEPALSGYVARYDEGVFEQVINVRIEQSYGYVPADWQSYEGYLALLVPNISQHLPQTLKELTVLPKPQK